MDACSFSGLPVAALSRWELLDNHKHQRPKALITFLRYAADTMLGNSTFQSYRCHAKEPQVAPGHYYSLVVCLAHREKTGDAVTYCKHKQKAGCDFSTFYMTDVHAEILCGAQHRDLCCLHGILSSF